MINERLETFFREKEALPRKFTEINSRTIDFIRDFTLSPGKRVRPVLVIAGYLTREENVPNSVLDVATAVEMFHAFLLTHDDFMDRDEFRRGQPTVWKRYENLGVSRHLAYSLAVVAGDLLYTYVFQRILGTDLSPEKKLGVIERLLETMELTGYGQNIDLYLTEMPLEKVRLDNVLLLYELKTGVYTISFPLTLGAWLAGCDESTLKVLHDFGVKAGTAFQIHDDIIGVFGDPEKTGKPVGSDIREGKRTFLIVEAYRRGSEEDRRVIEEFLGREDEGSVRRVMEIIESTGALEEARRLEKSLTEEAVALLEPLDIREDIKQFLKEFAVYLIRREK